MAIGVVAIRLFTDLAIPGWATFSLGLLAILMAQLLMFSGIALFIFLNSREQTSVMPKTMAPTYVVRRHDLLRKSMADQIRAEG
jgi:hypothetical protein